MFNHIRWRKFLSLKNLIYVRTIVEFICSVKLELSVKLIDEYGVVRFRLFNEEHALNSSEISFMCEWVINKLLDTLTLKLLKGQMTDQRE